MKKAIDIFFTEITRINGELLFTSNSLLKFSIQQKESLDKNELNINYAHVSRLAVSDIIGETDMGWFLNFPLKPNYIIRIEDLVDRTHEIINRQAGFSIVQSFESLKRLMRNSIITYFENKPEIGKAILSIESNEEIINWTKVYNNYSNQQKDIEFLTLIKISEVFKFGTNSNNYGIKLGDYLSILTLVRNRIVHNNFILSRDDYNNIGSKSDGIKILKYFFPHTKGQDEYNLDIGIDKVKKNLDIITEIGILVFKSFSDLLGYNWKEHIQK